jgi:hypothetical protein
VVSELHLSADALAILAWFVGDLRKGEGRGRRPSVIQLRMASATGRYLEDPEFRAALGELLDAECVVLSEPTILGRYVQLGPRWAEVDL